MNPYENIDNPEHIWTLEEVEKLRKDEGVYGQSWRIKVTDGKGRIETIDTPEWAEGSRSYYISNLQEKVGDVLFCYPTQRCDKDALPFFEPGFYTITKISGDGATYLEGVPGWITDDQILGKVFFQCKAETVLKGSGQYARCELEQNHYDDEHLVTIHHRWKD